MAIKVSGTTVIDDSQNLVNVGGLKTINSTSILGSGDIEAGASTTFGAVGTYTGAILGSSVTYNGGETIAGSSLLKYTSSATNQFERFANFGTSSASLSGTWRCMAPFRTSTASGYSGGTLWVRIS